MRCLSLFQETDKLNAIHEKSVTMGGILQSLLEDEKIMLQRRNPGKLKSTASDEEVRATISKGLSIFYQQYVKLFEQIDAAKDVHFKGEYHFLDRVFRKHCV